MKFIKKISSVLFVLSIPVILLTATIKVEINSMYLYEYGFDKYEVSAATQFEEEQLKRAAQALIDYFNYRIDTPQVNMELKTGETILLYQEEGMNRELTHLMDVRRLFTVNSFVLVICLIYAIGYSVVCFKKWKFNWPYLLRSIRYGCIITLVLTMATAFSTVIFEFEQLFFSFHHIAFSNPWWVSSGYLPRLFPLNFWADVVFFAGVATCLAAILIAVIVWYVSRIYVKKVC